MTTPKEDLPVNRGLRYKLLVAYSLMSILPVVALLYFMRSNLWPSKENMSLLLAIVFCAILSTLGFFLTKQTIEQVIGVAKETKRIAEGELKPHLPVESDDEIGTLARSINQITEFIKENKAELKIFEEKLKTTNMQIQKRVTALSALLQIGENVSASWQIEDIMTLVVDKVKEIVNADYVMLFFPSSSGSPTLECTAANNIADGKIGQMRITIGEGILGLALAKNETVYADSKKMSSGDAENIRKKFGVKNFAALPVTPRDKAVGLLFVGKDTGDVEFAKEDLELLQVFAKQAAIVYENDELAKKAKSLAIRDDLTGLYNKKYIEARLDEEIKRAVFYQRPCSFIVFNVDDFTKFREESGELPTEKALVKIAAILKRHTTQIGRAARLASDEFALLLPEKNKKEAYKIAEEIKKDVENLNLERGKGIRLTISGGVSENPLDGSTSDELMRKALNSVYTAKLQGKNRIV